MDDSSFYCLVLRLDPFAIALCDTQFYIFLFCTLVVFIGVVFQILRNTELPSVLSYQQLHSILRAFVLHGHPSVPSGYP